MRLEGADRPSKLVDGAASPGRGSPSASIFFGAEEAGTGSLRLIRVENGEVERVAEQVHVPSASFWFTGQSLFYVQQYDEAGWGELCMRLLSNGDTFCEAAVLDWRVMIRPERGVALTKQIGSEVRLFWAEVE
jgi:hypothetical protein